MSNQAVVVELTPEERRTLESLANSRTAPFRQQRARLILLAARGVTNTQIAREELSWAMVAGGAVRPPPS